jgi:hypothetical protein
MKKVLETSEKQIENECLDWLNRQDTTFAIKIDNSAPYSEEIGSRIRKNKYSPSGTPDAMVFIGEGRMFFIEFKRRSGKQSQEQKGFERKINSLGINYFVVRTLEECIEVYFKERDSERYVNKGTNQGT